MLAADTNLYLEDAIMLSQSMDHVAVIADNGGGITLQIDDGSARYQHTYNPTPSEHQDPATQCATEIIDYLTTEGVDGWEGNQAHYGWVAPTSRELQSGDYRVLTLQDILATDAEDSWANVRELKEALCRAVIEGSDTNDLLASAVREAAERN